MLMHEFNYYLFSMRCAAVIITRKIETQKLYSKLYLYKRLFIEKCIVHMNLCVVQIHKSYNYNFKTV